MKLELQELIAADCEAAKLTYGPDHDDLCGPIIDTVWPLTDTNAKERAEWSGQQQKELLANDTTARMVKVIDTANNNALIAIGRWHRYPDGYPNTDSSLCREVRENDPANFPVGFNAELYIGCLNDLLAARRQWMGEGHCWGKSSSRRDYVASAAFANRSQC